MLSLHGGAQGPDDESNIDSGVKCDSIENHGLACSARLLSVFVFEAVMISSSLRYIRIVASVVK